MNDRPDYCEASDRLAPPRHHLMAALAEVLGQEVDEEYVGAGCTTIIVAHDPFDYWVTNTVTEGASWTVDVMEGSGYLCGHDLGSADDDPKLLAIKLRDLMLAPHAPFGEEHPS